MTLESKKVLLTGAAGFIGSHVLDQLLSQGATVRAFIHYNGRYDKGLIPDEAFSKVEPFFGDLTDSATVDKAVQGMDIVIHMGALISVPYSYQQPRATMHVNVIGTLNILQASLRHQVKRVVVTSSSEVYGSAVQLPIYESHPMLPQSPYAASKVAADAISWSFYTSYGLPVIIARPFNTFGPRQSDRAFIPNVIKQALWRDQIEVGTLNTLRDYLFVEDTAKAFVACAIAPNTLNGETVHFGTGESWSCGQVVAMVQELLGVKKEVVQSEFRKRPNQSEVTHLLSAPTKAISTLSWKPTTPFMDGLKRTIEWIKRHRDAYDINRYAV